ncbi:DUF4386 domain-containing protein [Streptosporangium sp. NPDC000396]|uniref:DUF4386 domain-containing protein n=1 Tax=Streptosporangium sp. NPDC000396 TaxID=3366185 RepID=UPI0036C2021F
MRPPQRLARTAGVFWLIVGIFAFFAVYSRDEVYVPGDAIATARNVAANTGLVHNGFVADLVQATFFVFTAMALYLLLKHVNKNVARAMVTFVAISVAIMCLNLVHQLGALLVATDTAYASTLGAQGSGALVLLMLDLQHYGVLIAQIFFGLWLLPLGYLVLASRMFPRVLGVLLVIGCAGYLVDTSTRLLLPNLGTTLTPFLTAPAAVAEIAMLLWLIVKGAGAPRQDGQVLAAA